MSIEIVKVSKWVIKFNGLSLTVECEVVIICVIIAYPLESSSSLTQITHNLQATIDFKKKEIKKEEQKSEGSQ